MARRYALRVKHLEDAASGLVRSVYAADAACEVVEGERDDPELKCASDVVSANPPFDGEVDAKAKCEHKPVTSVSVPSRVAELVGDPSALVLLSQMIYWSRRGAVVSDRSGWISKTATQWAEDLGMSWKVQHRARRLLLEQGLIEERKRTMPARLEFRLRLDVLLPRLSERSGIRLPTLDWAWVADRRDPRFGELLGRGYLFHASLTPHMSIAAAMLASRLISATGQRIDGPAQPQSSPRWVQLHRADWLREAGLSRDQWQTARRHLKALGLLHERRRNYPRRVDLAIDLQAVRDLVAGTLAAQVDCSAGSTVDLNWAKHVGGIGHLPIPPAVSPDPADTDRPIPPSFVAQSNPYLIRSIEFNPPPLQRDWSAMAWGGGGWGQAIESKADTPSQAAPACPSADPELAWPECFEVTDRTVAARHLMGLDHAVQQCVLDEIDWQRANKAVRSPIGLLRSLCVKAREGTFMADGAHRIAAARRRRVEQARREQQATATGPVQENTDPAAVKARLQELRAVANAVRARGFR